MKIGSLCTGYGGLDISVEATLGGELAWVSDIDKGACKIIAHRYPDIPNLGDLTAIDWSEVEPVDILTAGYPCQPFSQAGRRQGTNDERHLWPFIRQAIRHLRPRLTVLENVAGHRSLGFDRVLGDMAEDGLHVRWASLRAADVGACHGRERVFLVVTDPRSEHRIKRREPAPSETTSGWALGQPSGRGRAPELTLLPTPTTEPQTGNGHARNLGREVQLLPTPSAADALGGHERRGGTRGGELLLKGIAKYKLLPTPLVGSTSPAAHGQISGQFRAQMDTALARFGDYAEAIARWESVIGRPAPEPTEPGKGVARRLSPAFVEWMMGLPAGWVTDVPGITRNEALKACGNGVVPQQAIAALRHMLTRAVAA